MKRVLITLFLGGFVLLSACQNSERNNVIPLGNESLIEEESAPGSQKESESLGEENKLSASEGGLPMEEEAQKTTDAEVQEEKSPLGWIEGSVSYPSEGLPEDLEVCAGQVEGDKAMYCTSQWIEDPKYTYGFGYKLAVPPGVYHLMAQRSEGGLIGWYSAFIPCGQTLNCTDHTPLKVEVKAGEGVEGIDPGDWYGN